MLEGATDGIWVKDTEGRYRMMNRSGARILGIDAEDAVGKTDFELFPAKHAQKVTVDDREILESGQGRTVEEVHMVNGVARTFDTVKGVCRDANGQVVALIGVFQDVTELNSVHEEQRKAQDELQSKVHERTADLARTNESLRREIAERKGAEEALRRSEERYRHLYDRTPAMLQSYDRDLKLVSVSDHWLEVMGYERDEVIGRYINVTDETQRLAAEDSLPALRGRGRRPSAQRQGHRDRDQRGRPGAIPESW